MTRIAALLLLLTWPGLADDFGRVLRRAKSGDRVERREALKSLADGRVRPTNPGQEAKMARVLSSYLSTRSLGTDRALAVQALGRLKDDKVYARFLKQLGKERDDRVLAAFEAAFEAAPPDTFKTLVARFRETPEEQTVQRAIYLRMACAVPGEKVRAFVRTRAAMIDNWVVHATAVQALRRDKKPGVLALCIELLDIRDPAVTAAAFEILALKSGKRFGRDIVSWKTWWNTRAKTESLEKAMAEADKINKQRPETRTVTAEERIEPVRSYFFGMPIRGRKVVYVFDISASMRKKLPVALAQLIQSVKGLPPRTRFEVVFFNENVMPWRGRLSGADPVTKALLIQQLKDLEIKSYTNLFDAMEKGLRLHPDEMFVISDGAPNRGRKRSTRDILSELKRLNAKARTAIHTVSVVRTVDGGEHIDLLKKVAAQNRGQSVQRTLY